METTNLHTDRAEKALEHYMMTSSLSQSAKMMGVKVEDFKELVRVARRDGVLRDLEENVTDLMRQMMMSCVVGSLEQIQKRMDEATVPELVGAFDKIFQRYQVIRGEASNITERRETRRAQLDIREEIADVIKNVGGSTARAVDASLPSGSRVDNGGSEEPVDGDVILIEGAGQEPEAG
jgi:NTP pyrophosphatase (non-canonical NTP hydrolase)|tara:strand:- start:119 stop:655 length:537 start_codon:yes stop_codon:yes gene_type:complete